MGGDVYVEGVGTRSNRCAALIVGPCVCWFVLLSLPLGACGGASAGSNARAESAHEKPSHEPDEASASDDSAPEEEAPKAGPCDDGTCSPCGSGVCLTGWYCDESASGGPACGWLPQCAQKSSCACLSGKLGAGCKCSEQGGGLHVSCK